MEKRGGRRERWGGEKDGGEGGGRLRGGEMEESGNKREIGSQSLGRSEEG